MITATQRLAMTGVLLRWYRLRDLVTGGNVDTGAIPNSEIFVYDTGTATFAQVTNTKAQPR